MFTMNKVLLLVVAGLSCWTFGVASASSNSQNGEFNLYTVKPRSPQQTELLLDLEENFGAHPPIFLQPLSVARGSVLTLVEISTAGQWEQYLHKHSILFKRLGRSLVESISVKPPRATGVQHRLTQGPPGNAKSVIYSFDKTGCIGVTGAARANIIMTNCNDQSNEQRWQTVSIGSGGNGLMNVAKQKCFDFWTTTAGFTAELNTCKRFGNYQSLGFTGFYIDPTTGRHYLRIQQGSQCVQARGIGEALILANCGDPGTAFYYRDFYN